MKKIKVFFIMSLILVLLISLTLVFPKEIHAQENKGNKYPLVFVHGLTGWGRDEAIGIKYWGGFRDLQQYLNNKGYHMLTATVGPVSSNYDRAVELYYNIKGGTVDYGAAHAAEHGHSRYGRTFEALYPEWDENHPVHLLGHSMGGPTSRELTDLLKDGSAKERAHYAAHPEDGISPLFIGDKEWIHSVTTIAAPNNGTTIAEDENEFLKLLKELILNIGIVTGTNPNSLIYDFKLEHWGIKRLPGESFTSYLNKVMASKIWDSKDVSLYDLSTKAIAESNKWMETQPNVYYFSHTGQTTYKSLLKGYQLPNILTNPIMSVPAAIVGKFSRSNAANGPIIDSSWWANDGMVNVKSSFYPFGHPAASFNGKTEPKIGTWNYYPVMNNWDHMDYIGILPSSYGTSYNINNFYSEIAETLYKLPSK